MVCLWYNVIQVVKKQFERNAGEKNMKKILDLITGEVTQAFVDCGYDAKYGKVTLSNRPELYCRDGGGCEIYRIGRK